MKEIVLVVTMLIFANTLVYSKDEKFETMKKERQKLSSELLAYAIEDQDMEKVKKYLKMGADVNTQDKDGWSPLMAFVYRMDYENVKLLIDKGANLNLVNMYGNTAMMHVASRCRQSAICDLDAVDNEKMIKLLVENGADYSIKNNEGNTLRDILIKYRYYGYNIDVIFGSYLMWQDESDNKTKKLSITEAFDYCTNLLSGGYKDWRVPSLDDLKSLYKSDQNLVYVNSDFYWSSSFDVRTAIYYYNIYDGVTVDSRSEFVGSKHYVRCVRKK